MVGRKAGEQTTTGKQVGTDKIRFGILADKPKCWLKHELRFHSTVSLEVIEVRLMFARGIQCAGGFLVYGKIIDPDGRRHSLDVLADSSYDAAHIFFTHATAHRGSGLPTPNRETTFEIAANGRIYKVTGVKLRDWILREGMRRNGPQGYLFSKRPVMD